MNQFEDPCPDTERANISKKNGTGTLAIIPITVPGVNQNSVELAITYNCQNDPTKVTLKAHLLPSSKEHNSDYQD